MLVYIETMSREIIVMVSGINILSIFFLKVQLSLILNSYCITTFCKEFARSFDKLYNGDDINEVIGLPGQLSLCNFGKI